jgi:hypothetical protein
LCLLADEPVNAAVLGHVVDRGEAPVLGFQINGKKIKVNPDRGKGAVPQDFLQREDVTAIHQVVLGKSVSESVGGTPHTADIGLFTAAPQHLLDSVPSERQPISTQE